MRKNRTQLLSDAHVYFTLWAEHMFQMANTSELGYAKRTVEGRMQKEAVGVQQSGFFKGRSPEVAMPQHVSWVDREVRLMPQRLKIAVLCKYWPEEAIDLYIHEFKHVGQWKEGQKAQLWTEITGLSQTTYYEAWERAKEVIVGLEPPKRKLKRVK